MRVFAYAEVRFDRAPLRRRIAFAVVGTLAFGLAPAFAFDGSTSNAPEKIP